MTAKSLAAPGGASRVDFSPPPRSPDALSNGSGAPLGHLISEFHRPYGEQALLWVTIALFMAISSALAAAQRQILFARYGLAPVLLIGTITILFSTFVRGRLDVWVHARGVAVRRAQSTTAALWS